jgi:hypothetical protein
MGLTRAKPAPSWSPDLARELRSVVDHFFSSGKLGAYDVEVLARAEAVFFKRTGTSSWEVREGAPPPPPYRVIEARRAAVLKRGAARTAWTNSSSDTGPVQPRCKRPRA